MAKSPTCGIAMCTCNGIAYLDAQLNSFLTQTWMPDRIVIGDDCSSDGTWQRLQQWAIEVRSSYCIDVVLMQNPERLGVVRNFESVISVVETDYVFLADQDDIWTDRKIEVLATALEENADVLLVHSDAFLIDEGGEYLSRSLFESLYLTTIDRGLAVEQRFFEVYCRRNLVTGTTAAFRQELLRFALPFSEAWIHDEWLAACAAAWSKVLMLPDKLTCYRQHGANAIGVPSSRLSRVVKYARRVMATPRAEYLTNRLTRLGALRQRLLNREGATSEALRLLAEAECHFERRKHFERGIFRRLLAVVGESRTRGYARFSDGAAGIVRDLIDF